MTEILGSCRLGRQKMELAGAEDEIDREGRYGKKDVVLSRKISLATR